MKKVDYFRDRIEFSAVRAELACSDDTKSMWLFIRESYRQLLHLETKVIPEQEFDLISLHAYAEAQARHKHDLS
jgi:hypothetical protein